MSDRVTIEFNGRKYHRYPNAKGRTERVYYSASGHRRLHTDMYKHYFGEIPEGHCIHHIDGNTENNDISNLELKTKSKHAFDHSSTEERKEISRRTIKEAIAKAPEWHRSEEGIKWHNEHAEHFKKDNRVKLLLKCVFCGEEYSCDSLSATRSKFCSNNCNSKHRRKSGVDNIVIQCVCCGKDHTINKYNKIKTCSSKCAASLRERDASNKFIRKTDGVSNF